MAEFCLKCYNRIHRDNLTEYDVVLTRDYELCEGDNIIIPTTNGFVYKVPIKNASNHSIDFKTDRAFFTTRSNNKYFALMLDKFTPFVYISAIGIEDSDGFIISPFLIWQPAISFTHI